MNAVNDRTEGNAKVPATTNEKVQATTREILNAEPKRILHIPRPDGDESRGVFLSINEVNYMVAFDEDVEVPESVFLLWQKKQAAERRAKAYVAEIKRQMSALSTGGAY